MNAISLQGITITVVFILLAHVFVVFAMLAMFIFLWRKTREDARKLERVIRFFAVVTGFFVYFGARASGFSMPDLMLNSINTLDKVNFCLKEILLPAATGTLVGWFCLMSLDRNTHIATRGVIVIAAFFLTMFTDVYAATYDVADASHEFDKALVPNLAFTIGLALYVILRFIPRPLKEAALPKAPAAQPKPQNRADEEQVADDDEEDVAPEKVAPQVISRPVTPAIQLPIKIEPPAAARPAAPATQPQVKAAPAPVVRQPPNVAQPIAADVAPQAPPQRGAIRIVKHDASQR